MASFASELRLGFHGAWGQKLTGLLWLDSRAVPYKSMYRMYIYIYTQMCTYTFTCLFTLYFYLGMIFVCSGLLKEA